MFTLSIAWILCSWYWLRGSLFEPYGLFVIATALFNGGKAPLELLGVNPKGILEGRFPQELVVCSLYLVTISILALHTGALVALAMRRSRSITCNRTQRERAVRITGWALLAASTFPSYLLLRKSLFIVMEHGYMELFRQSNSIGLLGTLSGLFVPGLIYLMAGTKGHRSVLYGAMAAGGVYIAICLLIGERAAAVMGGVAMAWVYDRTVRRIPRWLVVTAAVMALVVFTFVKDTRQQSDQSRTDLKQRWTAISAPQTLIYASLAEMGETQSVVAHVVALVPAVRDFDFGVSYLFGVVGIVPNVGWEVHPSVAHGLLCDWLIRTVDPVIADSGGGLGFSYIAEAYLNFGWAGGPVLIGIMGFGLGCLFNGVDHGDAGRTALVASFLSVILIAVRGESAVILRGLVWYSVFPYFLANLITPSSRRLSL
jgi:oligosaccharide repeat unit polymerase